MKTAIKVINFIGIIASIACAALLFYFRFEYTYSYYVRQYGAYTLLLSFFMLINALILSTANSKLKKASRRSDLIGIGIVTLLFGNVLSGILMLVIDDYQL